MPATELVVTAMITRIEFRLTRSARRKIVWGARTIAQPLQMAAKSKKTLVYREVIGKLTVYQ